ncbi:MAG: Mur ligase family protein [Patescibacteria group bacterium UBA2163]
MYRFVSFIVEILKKILPAPIVRPFLKPYHFIMALSFAIIHGFPAKRMVVLGVTGTKGKSTVSEMLFAILRAAGHTTALASTIRFAVNDESKPNQFKMTMQGRGHLQDFLGSARRRGATHAVVEITSEGTREFRNAFLFLNGLIVTNIAREHIESHGSFENYVAAKRSIVNTLEQSPKQDRVLVANGANEHTKPFLDANVPHTFPFSLSELDDVHATETSVSFSYKNTAFTLPLPGLFNAENALAAIKITEQFGVDLETAQKALAHLEPVRGRVERVEAGQSFGVIVDYAHTPDSLEALYGAFPDRRKVCVLGNTGGGRDTWKRPLMGSIADKACDVVILTNEDPYDEDPMKIVQEMAEGMARPPIIEMDRRTAIRRAYAEAKEGDVVLISGKGTDPYIMGADGTKTPWSDARVAHEELTEFLKQN